MAKVQKLKETKTLSENHVYKFILPVAKEGRK